MTDKAPKRRKITAVRRLKIVKEAIESTGLGYDRSINELVEELRDAAIAEIES